MPPDARFRSGGSAIVASLSRVAPSVTSSRGRTRRHNRLRLGRVISPYARLVPYEEIRVCASALKRGIVPFRAAVLDCSALPKSLASSRVRPESGSDWVLSIDTERQDRRKDPRRPECRPATGGTGSNSGSTKQRLSLKYSQPLLSGRYRKRCSARQTRATGQTYRSSPAGAIRIPKRTGSSEARLPHGQQFGDFNRAILWPCESLPATPPIRSPSPISRSGSRGRWRGACSPVE